MKVGTMARNISLSAGLILALFLLIPRPSLAADWYVSATLGSDTTGSGSMVAPCRSISKAVQMAENTDRVLVAEGVYYESIELCKVLTLLGGYEPLFLERIPSVYRTVIDGGNSATANLFIDVGSWSGFSLIIDGFILQNSDGGLEIVAAGEYPTVTVSNNIIRNHAEAGIWIGPFPPLDPLAFIVININLYNNLIVGNEIGVKTTATVSEMGGISDILFRSRNDTISGNRQGILMESYPFSGIWGANRSDIRNSIIWGNSLNNYAEGPGTRVQNYSDIQGDTIGTGNLDADPLFFDPFGTDHQLQPGSPAINAGDPDPAYNDPDGSRNDMGFTGGPDSAWSDHDHDGMGDAWETFYGFNPLDPSDGVLDGDGDGIINRLEFFVGANPLAADTADCDNDGLLDIAEPSYRTETCIPDTDGDFLPDGWEVRFTECSFNPRSLDGQMLGLRLTAEPSGSRNPYLAWTGSEFGVSWSDERDGNKEIYFARLDAQGTKVGSDIRVTTDAASSSSPSLVWTGSAFGVSWSDERDGNKEIYFARLDAQGVKLGSDMRVTTDAFSSYSPTLVWAGSEFGVSWQYSWSQESEIFFARIDAQGTKIGSDTTVTVAYVAGSPSLVWTGSEFGVSWNEWLDYNYDRIIFARLSAQGAKIGTNVRISAAFANNSRDPSLVWTGSEFGVSWQDSREVNTEIYFARVDAQGTKIGSDVKVTTIFSSSYSPFLAWNGSEFCVSWHDYRDGNYEIYLARLGAQGNKIGSDVRVTADAASSSFSSLAWTGSEFCMSWEDNRDGNYEVYFSRLFASLVYTDKDGDGSCEDQEFAKGTDPCDPDSDDDFSTDGTDCEPLDPFVFPAAPEICDGIDNQCQGDIGYGQTDEGCDVDSDGDGLMDWEEIVFATNPLDWDTDGDGLSDYLEHYGAGLDPLNASDALSDFDLDQNPNLHEVYNGTDMNEADPQGHFNHAQLGCCYWADADGDGILGPNDIAGLENDILGLGADYSEVIPPTGLTMDADGDGSVGPGDLSEANNMLLGLPLPYIGGRADSLVVLDSPAGPVAAGDTCRVTIGVRNEADLGYAQGFAVIFEVVSGDAAILGGDGSASFAAPGNRYDFSGPAGSSSIVVRPNSSGAITIDAFIPSCGTPGVGRSCAEIGLLSPVTISSE